MKDYGSPIQNNRLVTLGDTSAVYQRYARARLRAFTF